MKSFFPFSIQLSALTFFLFSANAIAQGAPDRLSRAAEEIALVRMYQADGISFYDRQWREEEKRQRLEDERLRRERQDERKSHIILTEDGRYLNTETGEEVSFEEARAYILGRSANRKTFYEALVDFSRMSLQLGGSLGVGAFAYWVPFQQISQQDWEFRWNEWRRKYVEGEGVRFDNNAMYLNSPGHPMAGAWYYLIGRGNGYNAFQSLLVSAAGSLIWEGLIEFREVFSLNDMVMTPVAGWAVGEALYQLGDLFAQGDSRVSKVLSAVFDSPSAYNRWMADQHALLGTDKQKYNGRMPDYRVGLSTGAGVTALPNGALVPTFEIGFDSELIHLPKYGEESNIQSIVAETAFTEFLLQSSFGEKGLQDFTMFAKNAFYGYQKQKISNNDAHLKGYSFYVGLSTAFEHSERELSGVRDQFGIAHVLGSTLDLTVFYGDLSVRVSMDLYGDFALVKSYALEELPNGTPFLDQSKVILRDHGYYFALGGTTRGRLLANYKAFEMHLLASHSYYDSIEGHDRHQEQVVYELNSQDSRKRLEGKGYYQIPGLSMKIGARYEHEQRRGVMEDLFYKEGRVNRFMGEIIFSY
jgi:hypothetical protein